MKHILSLALVITIVCLSAGPAHAAPPADLTYVVQRGDTLFSIALRFGVTVQAIMRANGLTNADLIFVGQRLIIPTGTSGATGSTGTTGATGSTSSGGSPGICGSTYTVQRGDTLRIIASKCGTTINAIASLNGITNRDLIFVGQVLRMPGSSGSSGSTGSTGGTVVTTPPPASTPPPSGTSRCGAVYTIQRGDTLRIIADKCGVTAQAILANNVLPNPNLIYPGQQLSIPGGSPSIPPAPTTAPASTPPPAATPAPPPVTTSHGVTGQLTLCNPEKPSFAADIERICFRELITNTTGAPVSYGLLGVSATNLTGGPDQFQTSWRGDLSVPPFGTGPTGGGWEDGIYIDVPGTYRLQLALCFSNVDGCLSGIGWEVLTSGVDVKVVDWHP
mgnify:CR=1 FL=1